MLAILLISFAPSSICFRTRLISLDTSPNLCIAYPCPPRAESATRVIASQSARVIVRGTVINQEARAEGAYGGLDGVGPGPAGAWGRRRGRGWPGLGGDGEHAAEAALVLVRGAERERGDEPGHDPAPAEPPALQQVRRRGGLHGRE